MLTGWVASLSTLGRRPIVFPRDMLSSSEPTAPSDDVWPLLAPRLFSWPLAGIMGKISGAPLAI